MSRRYRVSCRAVPKMSRFRRRATITAGRPNFSLSLPRRYIAITRRRRIIIIIYVGDAITRALRPKKHTKYRPMIYNNATRNGQRVQNNIIISYMLQYVAASGNGGIIIIIIYELLKIAILSWSNDTGSCRYVRTSAPPHNIYIYTCFMCRRQTRRRVLFQ